jgi:hypothetical protein
MLRTYQVALRKSVVSPRPCRRRSVLVEAFNVTNHQPGVGQIRTGYRRRPNNLNKSNQSVSQQHLRRDLTWNQVFTTGRGPERRHRYRYRAHIPRLLRSSETQAFDQGVATNPL